MHSLQLWIHVVSSAVFLGATVLFALLLPVIQESDDPADKRRRLAALARIYDPLAIGILGVALMTGAFNLTDYKARLGPRFFAELGGVLGLKLLLAFLLILIATSITFGIGHRSVREEQWGEPVEEAALNSRLRRLPYLLWTVVGLTAAVFALGLRMVH